jgi:nitroimidazol reductase NimA-like FMN-containing flavoprotein (pyridoxamine 5'-phosphate oxidase superfamily)
MEPLPGRVKELIAKARVCRIATVRPSGEPHVIPVGPVFDGENLYIDIGGGYVTAAAIASDPNVEFGWEPRLTLALRIYDWRQWGVT